MSRRVRVGVKYGDTSIDTTSGPNYAYLVDPSKANVGQRLTVPVNRGSGIYFTTATVVEVAPKSGQVKRPRVGK